MERCSSEGELGEPVSQLCGFALSYGQHYLAACLKVLSEYARLHVFDDAHDAIHHGVGELVGDGLFNQSLLDDGIVEGCSGCLAVGDDETAGAEVDASIIAHHDDEDVGEATADYLPEDGLAGCGRGLAVVVGAEDAALGAEPVGVAAVARVVVLLAVVRHYCGSLVGCVDMMGKGEKLAAFLGVVALACLVVGDCQKTVFHLR